MQHAEHILSDTKKGVCLGNLSLGNACESDCRYVMMTSVSGFSMDQTTGMISLASSSQTLADIGMDEITFTVNASNSAGKLLYGLQMTNPMYCT